MTSHFPVIDLHCDLLYYLAVDKTRTAHDREARCSIPQLQEGGVLLQTLAIYTETKEGSALLARKQFEAYENLPLLYPQEVRKLHHLELPTQKDKIHFLASIENASGLCEEKEPLEKAFSRLEEYQEVLGPLVYLSLTWNDENRFGGGNRTSVGLKKDGEALLEVLADKGIPIDLSHTSDHLAFDIFNTIEKKGLDLMIIASHSNFREVTKEARNLPDEFAKEIINRGGVIGLNFVKWFIGDPVPDAFEKHIEHAQKLGGVDALCLGADFFSDVESTFITLLQHLVPFFHEEYDTSGCYPHFFEALGKRFDRDLLEKIAYKNCAAFFKRLTIKETVL